MGGGGGEEVQGGWALTLTVVDMAEFEVLVVLQLLQWV